MQVFLLRFTKNGGQVDAEFFVCVWAMTLKLFRGASNDLTQCFKLLEHTNLSCRTRHTPPLAQVASLLLNWYEPSVVQEFSKCEAIWAKASVWQVLQLKCKCSNNLNHCVRSLEAPRKSFNVIAQIQKKKFGVNLTSVFGESEWKDFHFLKRFMLQFAHIWCFLLYFFRKMALEFFLDVVFTYYKKLKHAGTCSCSSGKLFICTKCTQKKFGVKPIFGAWGSLWILLLYILNLPKKITY